MIRLRVRFAKRGKVRFTSHRDVARLWERALRKAGVDVAYSEGFSPRPKLSFGLALSTGHESEAEYLEIRLAEGPRTDTDLADLDSLGRRLDEALPAGIDVLAVAASDQKNDSLQQAVTACTWRFEVDDLSVADARRWVADLLATDQIVVERERKGTVVSEDLRHQVFALDVIGATATGVRLEAELGTQPRALRPAELLAASNPPLRARYVCRMHQWMLQGDERVEPLAVDAGPAPLANQAGVMRREPHNVRTDGHAPTRGLEESRAG